MFEPQPRYRYSIRVVEGEKILVEGQKILLEYHTFMRVSYREPPVTIGSLMSEVQASLSRIVITDGVAVLFEVRRVA
jgi:hypothetical protein